MAGGCVGVGGGLVGCVGCWGVVLDPGWRVVVGVPVVTNWVDPPVKVDDYHETWRNKKCAAMCEGMRDFFFFFFFGGGGKRGGGGVKSCVCVWE